MYKKKINLKLMLLLLFGYSSKASKHLLMDILIEKFYLPFYHKDKIPMSLVSVEDEVSENDINRIELMKSKFTTTVGKSSYFIFNDDSDTENESSTKHEIKRSLSSDFDDILINE